MITSPAQNLSIKSHIALGANLLLYLPPFKHSAFSASPHSQPLQPDMDSHKTATPKDLSVFIDALTSTIVHIQELPPSPPYPQSQIPLLPYFETDFEALPLPDPTILATQTCLMSFLIPDRTIILIFLLFPSPSL